MQTHRKCRAIFALNDSSAGLFTARQANFESTSASEREAVTYPHYAFLILCLQASAEIYLHASCPSLVWQGCRKQICQQHLTLAEVSNHPVKPWSLQNWSIWEGLWLPSFFWSHLLARRTAGMGLPLGRWTLLSRSLFHFKTASNVELLERSKTTNAPRASL